MVNHPAAQPLTSRYGPVTFISAVANIVVVEVAVWTFLPWFVLVIFVLPLLLVDLAIAVVLRARPGVAGQVGRGMLIGTIAAPATLAVLLPGLLIAQAMDLV